jgi:hypothetical protein
MIISELFRVNNYVECARHECFVYDNLVHYYGAINDLLVGANWIAAYRLLTENASVMNSSRNIELCFRFSLAFFGKLM